MERCRSHLKDLYMKRRSKIQFGSSRKSVTDLDSLFVDLELVNEGKIGVKCEEQPQSHLDLLNIKDNRGDLCTHVLLRGYAGSGKTTLINKLAYGWAHWEHPETSSIFDRFRLVFVLDVRRIGKGESLEDAIRKQLLPNISKEDILNIFKHENASCLWLIDGYDEISSEGIEDMAEMLENPILSRCWVIMTTRPHMIDIFNQHCNSYHEYVHVNVSGFSYESIGKYVKKFFQLQYPEGDSLSHKDHAQSLIRRIKNVPILRSLSSYPILLLMICHLWLDKSEQEEQDLPENLTQLYREGIEYLNKHWLERYGKDKDKILLELGRVAIKHLFRDELSFKAELNTSCLEDACEIGLTCREEMNRHKTVYSFIHKTFHEFSAATYLASLADGDDSEFIEYIEKIDDADQIDKMEYLLFFCCGLSGKAASFILGHVMKIFENVEGMNSNRRLIIIPIDEAPDDRLWNLPLKLFTEAERQLLERGDMEGIDRLEKEVCDNYKAVRKLKVSPKVFNPYPFNISLLLNFLLCMTSLQKLYLHKVSIDGVERVNDNVLVMCKYLEVEGESTSRFNFMSLLSLLHHFPVLENLSLKSVEIETGDMNLSIASNHANSEHERELLKSIKTLFVCRQPNTKHIMALMAFLPSVEKLQIVKAEADGEWNEDSSSRIFPQLKDFSINLELQLRSQYRGLSLSEMNKPKVSTNLLANITMKMPGLETLDIDLSHFSIVGDMELNMGQLKHLKVFKWKNSSIIGNNIIMINKLLLCMPSLECYALTFSWPTLELLSEVADADLSKLYTSHRCITYHNCCMTVKTLMGVLNRMLFVKHLCLSDVSIKDNVEEDLDADVKRLTRFDIDGASLTDSTLCSFASHMPLVQTLEINRATIGIVTGFRPNMKPWSCLSKLTMRKMTISSNSLMKVLNHMPSLNYVTFNDVDVQEMLSEARYTGVKVLKRLCLFYAFLSETTFTFFMKLFGCLSSVETLSLSYLRGDGPEGGNIYWNTLITTLSRTPLIEKLELNDVQITELLDNDFVVKYVSLKELVLHTDTDDDDVVEKIDLLLLHFLPSLEILSVTNVGLTYEMCENLQVVSTSLKHLELSFSCMCQTPLQLKILHLIPALEELKICNIRLTEECDSEVPAIYNSLKVLNISYTEMNTELSAVSMRLLHSFPSLESLDLFNVYAKEFNVSSDFKLLKVLKLRLVVDRHSFLVRVCLPPERFRENALTTLANMLRCSPNLHTLDINNSLSSIEDHLKLDSNFLSAVVSKPKVFIHKHLYTEEDTMDNLKFLLRHMPMLETMKLSHSASMLTSPFTADLSKLVDVPFKMLTHLDIDASYEITDYFQTWLNRMPKLTTLSIGRCQFAVESTTVKTLTVVYSSDMEEEHPKSSMNFLCSMPSLELFTLVVDPDRDTFLSYFKNVDSNETMDSRVESLKGFQIRRKYVPPLLWASQDALGAEMYVSFDYSTIVYFLRCMPQLQTFECEGLEISSQSNEANVSKFTFLRACKLARCKVDGHTLIVLLASMPALEVLTLDEVDIVGPIVGDLDHKVFELCEELQQCRDTNEDMRMRIRDAARILKDQIDVKQTLDWSSDSDSDSTQADSDSY